MGTDDSIDLLAGACREESAAVASDNNQQ